MSNNQAFLSKYGSSEHINQIIDGNDENSKLKAFNDNKYLNDSNIEYAAKSDDILNNSLAASRTKSDSTIKNLINKNTHKITLSLIRNPNLSHGHIDQIIKNYHGKIHNLQDLAWNENLNSSHARQIIPHLTDSWNVRGLITRHMHKDTGVMNKENIHTLLNNVKNEHGNNMSLLNEVKSTQVYKKHFPDTDK